MKNIDDPKCRLTWVVSLRNSGKHRTNTLLNGIAKVAEFSKSIEDKRELYILLEDEEYSKGYLTKPQEAVCVDNVIFYLVIYYFSIKKQPARRVKKI